MSSEEIRCYKDDKVMETDAIIPGYVRCAGCGFFAELIDATDAIFDDYEAVLTGRLPPDEGDYDQDPYDGAERPWGHFAPLRKRKPKPGVFESDVPSPGPVERSRLTPEELDKYRG